MYTYRPHMCVKGGIFFLFLGLIIPFRSAIQCIKLIIDWKNRYFNILLHKSQYFTTKISSKPTDFFTPDQLYRGINGHENPDKTKQPHVFSQI